MGEVVLVGHLEGEHDTGEGGAKDGGHSGSRAAHEHQTAIAGFEAEAVEFGPEP